MNKSSKKLAKNYRLGGEEGSNKMLCTLCTCILYFYPQNVPQIQDKIDFSPNNWLWNSFDIEAIKSLADFQFDAVFLEHKTKFWDQILKEITNEQFVGTRSQNKKESVANVRHILKPRLERE